MKKKLSKISVLLVLMLTLAVCFAFGASAEETTYTEGYFTYTVTDGKATITAVDTAISGDITTPATLGGYPVTVIGKEAFQHCSDITSIVVSEGVEVIELNAFYDCSALESATLPDSLTTLGSSPFMFTNMKELAIPKNVSDIEPGAFLGVFTDKIVVDEENPYYSTDEYGVLFNEDKTTLIAWPALCSEVNYTVPETVKIINIAAFGYVPRLEAVTLPEGLEEIGEAAFCISGIKSINIPASVKTIHKEAFVSAFDLEEFIVDEDNPYFSSEDGVLFNKDKTSLLCYPEGKTDRTYVVPETVTSLYDYFGSAFYLRKLTFSNNVDVLGSSGSHGLLTDIVFEENVTKISRNLIYSIGFKKNVYIKGMNVEMPEVMPYTLNSFETSFVSHGGDPDTYAEKTKEMYKKIYGTPVSEAEAYAYQDEWDSKYGFEYLDEPVINAEIVCHSGSTAAAYAQENGIPYTTKCFYGEPDSEGTMKCINCDGTRSYYHDENEAFENGFIYVVYNGEAIILETGYSNDDFTGYVEIPETLGGYPVTTLPEFLFQNDSDITGIFIPASVTSIGRGAFENCSDLISINVDKNNPAYTSVEGVLYDKNMKVLHHYPKGSTRTSYTVPDGVIGIGYAVFYGCDTLESITLPDTLISIGDDAFYRCTSLVDLKLPEGVKLIGEDAFVFCDALTDLVIPEGAVVWGEESEDVIVDEYGVTFSKDMTTLIKYPAESTNTSYIIPDSVTTIEDYAFSYASNLTEIIIPDSVTTIGDYAFYYASNLTEIIIPESVTTIGDYAFCDASNLTEIIVSDNIISIGGSILDYTGYYNDTANWEDGYLYLGKYLIDENSDSTDFVLKEGTLGIAYSAANSEYTSVTLCEGLKSIGNHNFSNNALITSVEIPDSVVYIGKGSFSYCDALSEIKFNTENLEFLGEYAFGYTAYTYDLNNWKDGVCTIGNAIVACDIGTVKVDENIKFIVDENAYWMPLSFDVDENNPYFSSDETGSLYNKDKTKLIRYNGFCKNESYVIPETVKEIGEYAFCYSLYLKELTVPDSVEIIGEGAFEAVVSLENIYFQPDNLYLEDSYLGICGELALVEDEAALWEEYWNIIGLSLKFERGEFIPTEEEMAEFESRMAYIEENMVSNRWDFAQGTIHCHEGSLTDIYALSYGVNVEYTHFFKNWTYDWENYERTAKCIYCDETTTEALEKPENIETETEIEIIAPVIDEDTKFVVETIEDEADENYILVTEALEAVEGPAEIEKIYDITLQNSENVAIQPDGSVQVKLPVENTHENYKVFRVNEDGTYTDMNATVVDGYVVFVTDHFSLYVVVDTTEAHEHSYTEKVTKPATHMEEGEKTFTCSACGDSYTEVIEKDPKHHAELKYKSATCTEDGYERAVCECGFVMVDKVYEKLGHFYNYTITLHPTHTREGSEIADCIRCDDTFTNTIDKLPDHYYGYFVKTYDPTCTEGGYTVHQCSCGDSYTDSYTSALGHTRSKNGDWCSVCGADMEPEKKDCDHMCHQSGFMGFIWSIVQFFWKLFKMNPVCECGAAHY